MYSIPVQSILLFKPEFRFSKDLLCSQHVLDPSQASLKDKRNQESGNWLFCPTPTFGEGSGGQLCFIIFCFSCFWKNTYFKMPQAFIFLLFLLFVFLSVSGILACSSQFMYFPQCLSLLILFHQASLSTRPHKPRPTFTTPRVFPELIWRAGYSTPYLQPLKRI